MALTLAIATGCVTTGPGYDQEKITVSVDNRSWEQIKIYVVALGSGYSRYVMTVGALSRSHNDIPLTGVLTGSLYLLSVNTINDATIQSPVFDVWAGDEVIWIIMNHSALSGGTLRILREA